MVHRYTNPVRTKDKSREMYNTTCGLVVERFQCVASDFKTTCETCIKEIIKVRETELAILKEKLSTDKWKFKDLK